MVIQLDAKLTRLLQVRALLPTKSLRCLKPLQTKLPLMLELPHENQKHLTDVIETLSA